MQREIYTMITALPDQVGTRLFPYENQMRYHWRLSLNNFN